MCVCVCARESNECIMRERVYGLTLHHWWLCACPSVCCVTASREGRVRELRLQISVTLVPCVASPPLFSQSAPMAFYAFWSLLIFFVLLKLKGETNLHVGLCLSNPLSRSLVSSPLVTQLIRHLLAAPRHVPPPSPPLTSLLCQREACVRSG